MKKIVSVILILTLCATLLVSCSQNRGEVVIGYGDATINQNLYLYELAMMKTQLLQEYTGATTDIPQLWESVLAEGVTFDDYAYAQCQTNICSVLYFADYAIKNGAKLTKEEKKTIEDSANELINDFGSKTALNKYLETYTIDIDMYKEYLELYTLYSKGVALAYSENGDRAIPLEDMMKYYENNFVTVKHIAIGTDFAGADEEGNYVYYTEEEKAIKKQTIETIVTALENGEDFENYYSYSEDKSYETYPDGYTITRGVLDTTMQGYENTAFALKEGEWDTFELEGVCTYIIKRVPLLESDFENCAPSIMNSLVQLDMAQAIIDNYDNFTMNQDLIDMYNMASVPVMQ